MKKLLLGILFLIPACWLFSSHKVMVPVAGDWEFRQVGKEEWHAAEVPGVVHTDLFRNGMIPDPFYRNGEQELEWIEQEDWEYRIKIDIPRRLFRVGHIELVMEGLDTYADVFLNDSLVLGANNMFLSWEKDIKPYLKPGPNELRVRFHSPIKETAATRMMYPYQLPADNDAGDSKASVFVRKAPIQFGWDMAPRFVTMGIWKPVYIRLWDHATIRDLQFRTLYLDDEIALVDGLAFVEGEGAGKEFPSEVQIKVQGQTVWDTSFVMDGREQVIPFLLTIQNPQKWWPRGYGEPNLYDIRATLGKSGNIDDSLEVAYGLRTMELERKTDDIGTSFTFKVNGTPIYAKGAGYIPEDIFTSRADVKQKALREHILDAHFNMLRIWGGGVYKSDEFYNWCDANGILIWQDLIFACAMYPHGPDFHNRVTDELIAQFLRLRNHPSIALWCGNNEIDVAWKNWGWQAKMGYAPMDSFNLWEGYQQLFHEIIPSLVERYDPDRPYIASTPQSNWGTPINFTRHDNHYWGVWHGKDDLDGFKDNVPRFMSEFGMQSFPVAESLEPYAQEGDLEMGSDWMENRQKSYKGNEFLFSFTERWLGQPKDSRSAFLMSQVTQSIAMEIAIEAQRGSAPFCMGTIYWQFNDCWPGPSWSTIDYEGRPKAAHYALKRLFAPQMVSLDLTQKGYKEILVDDTRALKGKIKVQITDMQGKAIHASEKIVEGNGREMVYKSELLPLGTLKKVMKGKAVAFVTYENEGDTMAYKIVHALPMKKLKLQKPEFETELKKVAGGYLLKVTANTFAKSVRVDLPGKDAKYSDQFFDLFPQHTHRVMIETEQDLKLADMKIESLFDWRE